MDYEQKYKGALERANTAYKDEDRHLKATLERIFPELVESEDEKIRKAQKAEEMKTAKRNRTMNKNCGIEFPYFGASYPDARCCNGYLWDMDSWDESLGGFTIGGNEPCPVCNTEKWLDSVVDEDGEFETREKALAYAEQLKTRYLNVKMIK